MPNIFQNFKALLAPILAGRRVTFSPTHFTGGGSGGRVGFMGDLTHRGLASSGLASSAFDLDATCGDVLDNSIVAACVNAIAQALPEAPILLERRVNGVDFERIDSHPVLDLLHNPNPFLSEAELWGITTAFERTRGEAFWYFEYEAGGSVPKEIWFRAPQFVQVLSDEQRFISAYRITSESGQQVELDDCDVVHFRHQLSPYNPRAGWTPLHTGRRQIVGDNSASLYHGAILRNAGAASLIISLKDAAAAGEVTPGQLDGYVQQFKRKSSGAGAGAILGMDLPLDVHKVGFSPDEMALDKLLEYYESRICALMGVNRRVINLGQDPTYENSRVALNDFWERTIIPMRRRHAATLSSQLLPLFGLDPSQYRLSFDFSEVEALRENVDALHTRWCETLAAGGIDLFTFQEKIGLTPEENLKGRFVKVSAAMEAESEGGDEIKNKEGYDPNQPRDENGQWTSGGAIVLQSPFNGPASEMQGSNSKYGNWKGTPDEFVAQFAHALVENCAIYDSQGNQLCHIIGGQYKAQIPTRYAGMAPHGIMVHNHPLPTGSFSIADLSTASLFNVKETRVAVVLNGKIGVLKAIRRGSSWDLPSHAELEAAYKQVVPHSKAVLGKRLVALSKYDSDAEMENFLQEYNFHSTHERISQLAKRYGKFDIRVEEFK